jgi:hypothetical protein
MKKADRKKLDELYAKMAAAKLGTDEYRFLENEADRILFPENSREPAENFAINDEPYWS